jgi:hypothetical protein
MLSCSWRAWRKFRSLLFDLLYSSNNICWHRIGRNLRNFWTSHDCARMPQPFFASIVLHILLTNQTWTRGIWRVESIKHSRRRQPRPACIGPSPSSRRHNHTLPGYNMKLLSVLQLGELLGIVLNRTKKPRYLHPSLQYRPSLIKAFLKMTHTICSFHTRQNSNYYKDALLRTATRQLLTLHVHS